MGNRLPSNQAMGYKVISVDVNGPANLAGLQNNADFVLSVNGISLASLERHEIARIVKVLYEMFFLICQFFFCVAT
jgi:predicted metalloprotease with PDZ domain